MSILRPFRAIRPIPERASQVAAVPYDVVSRSEAAQLAEGNPLSFLHISRAEIDLDPATNPYSDAVYQQARKSFDRLIAECPMKRENTPHLLIYRLTMGGRQQTGIVGTFSIDEYDGDLIKKHERTRRDKEDDRTRHVLTLDAQTGPVFLAYRGLEAINAEVSSITSKAPEIRFTAVDGVTHELWSVAETAALVRLFGEVQALYIADGHHRAASASRARAEKKKLNPAHTGQEDYNFVMAVAFPAQQLKILPYHRVVLDLGGLSADEFLKKLDAVMERTPGSADPAKGEFSMFLREGTQARWYRLKPRAGAIPAPKDVISGLDVSVLQNNVLSPILGIQDPRSDQRIDFVGGIRGTAELEKWVNSGKAAVAFSMHPTSLDDLFAVSDAGEIMPPKSTWFEPKLRDGLFSHPLS